MLRGLEKRLGNLRIRLKLMVFHNVFFSVLTLTIYISVIFVLQHRLDGAYQREAQMIRATLATNPRIFPTLGTDIDYEEGTAAQLGMPPEIEAWADAHAGEVWFNPKMKIQHGDAVR
ncbi:MAG: hypothetical protein LC114_17975, partial [Bryobacterales bacterium]|nr:hypothetical protein [Bryobacterales bacterium]